MNESKICFITCTNKEFLYEECLRYIKALHVPNFFEVEIIAIRDALSLTEGYNRAMRQSDAKYKVYLHQDTFIINKFFIQNVIDLFEQNHHLGMLGMIGAKKLPENGVWWNAGENRYGKVYENARFLRMEIFETKEVIGDYESVDAVDGLILITQYDVYWREDLFKGWDFYDISQAMEFKRAGYEIGIPNQEECWCIHDCGATDLTRYEENQKKFLIEYHNDLQVNNNTKKAENFYELIPSSYLYAPKETNESKRIDFNDSLYYSLQLQSGGKFESSYLESFADALTEFQSKNLEFSLFDLITLDKIKQLFSEYKNVLGVGYWSHLVEGEQEIRHIELENMRSSIRNLVKRFDKEAVFITNVYLANLMLMMDNLLLEEMNPKKNSSIILPFIIPTRSITVEWAKGFKEFSHDHGNCLRWNTSESNDGVIRIINSSDFHINVQLFFEIYVPAGNSELIIDDGEYEHTLKINDVPSRHTIELLLPPGKRKLNFKYKGSKFIKIESDLSSVQYNFSVQNLIVINKTENYQIEKEEVYSVNNLKGYYLSDAEIRRKLHQNGYFEIRARSYSNHAFTEFDLPDSRFIYPDSFLRNRDLKLSDYADKGTYFVLAYYKALRNSKIDRREKNE